MRFLLTLIILIIFSSTLLAATSVESEKARLKKIQQELELKKSKLLETKIKEGESLSQLVQLKTQISKAKRELNSANIKIAVNEEQLGRLRTEIKETTLILDEKTSKLKGRIKEIFKNSSVNYLDLLFSSRNMSDFINRSYFFSKLVEGDVGLINLIESKYQEKESKKQTLQVVTYEIKDLAQNISEEKQKMDEAKTKEQQVYSGLKERREEYEQHVAQLEKSSEELTQTIQREMAMLSKNKKIVLGSGALDWPLRGRITSNYGYRRHPFWGGRHLHTGMDIAAPYGTPIKAADGGEVILSRWWDGYGKAIVISHGKNVSTVYGHMSRLYAQEGTQVSKGQVIGLIGSTGYSTGPHLHFEVRIDGRPNNPTQYLP